MNGKVFGKLTHCLGIVLPWPAFSSNYYCAIEHHVLKCYTIMDQNGHRQLARPSLQIFILKELNAVECKDLACETSN